MIDDAFDEQLLYFRGIFSEEDLRKLSSVHQNYWCDRENPDPYDHYIDESTQRLILHQLLYYMGNDDQGKFDDMLEKVHQEFIYKNLVRSALDHDNPYYIIKLSKRFILPWPRTTNCNTDNVVALLEADCYVDLFVLFWALIYAPEALLDVMSFKHFDVVLKFGCKFPKFVDAFLHHQVVVNSDYYRHNGLVDVCVHTLCNCQIDSAKIIYKVCLPLKPHNKQAIQRILDELPELKSTFFDAWSVNTHHTSSFSNIDLVTTVMTLRETENNQWTILPREICYEILSLATQ